MAQSRAVVAAAIHTHPLITRPVGFADHGGRRIHTGRAYKEVRSHFVYSSSRPKRLVATIT